MTRPASLDSDRPAPQLVAFGDAVAKGDVEAVQAALRTDASLGKSVLTPQGSTALMLAVWSGHIDCVQALLPHSNPTAFDRQGASALCMAAGAKRVEILQVLLEHEACQEQLHTVKWGVTPLMRASTNASVECVRLLSPYMAAHTTERGVNALMMAAQAGSAACITVLLAHCDARAADNQGATAIFYALKQPDVPLALECLRLLWPHSNPNARNHNGKTALEYALSRWQYKLADWMALANPTPRATAQWVIESVPASYHREFPQCRALLEKHALIDTVETDRLARTQQTQQPMKRRGIGGEHDTGSDSDCLSQQQELQGARGRVLRL